ncbi:LysR family transcriptional regulator [Luteibacter yeojuensis]|uniref:LysR family transcriptional regulator n=1 Tax=Luteibacter yeojuensis TaxID=345309 RepID=A0A7X5QRG0_9GAMM|nr:LysR family transcriptional regulator [Luteibacter yeojuensis]NID14021.1 LysR family transcriptional regulator [Luteibacter yeojuensis]
MQRSMISMALSSVSLRDLALVQAVAREGSFNSAARAMYISPSGLSHQVQKVEQALGVPLFERGGRRVVPTASGQRLLGYIEEVLASAEHLEHAARVGDVAFGGELRLGVPSTLGPYLLPHFIEPFPQRFPGARLTISEGKPRGLLRRLHEGELDAVLAPPAATVAGLDAVPLFFEPYELMFHAAHPLAGRGSVALTELDASEATLMAESHGNGVSDLGMAGSARPERIQDLSIESLATLVALRGGYTLVPILAHERLGSIPNVVMAAVEGARPGRHISLYWRSATPWREDLAGFGELLRALAEKIPGLDAAGV